MISLKIVSVDKGPQDEGSFDGQSGTIYKTAWLCKVEANGEEEVAKLVAGSLEQGSCATSKYIKAGCTVCAKQRKEYKGKAEYYLDSKATKEANGEGFRGGGSGGFGGGGGGGKSGGFAPNDGTGQAIGNAITNATNVVIAEMKEGAERTEVDLERLAVVADAIFAVSRKLNGANAAKPEAKAEPGEDRDALLASAYAAVAKAGLKSRLDSSDFDDRILLDMWKAEDGNAAAFAVKLAGVLPAAKKAGEPENLPF